MSARAYNDENPVVEGKDRDSFFSDSSCLSLQDFHSSSPKNILISPLFDHDFLDKSPVFSPTPNNELVQTHPYFLSRFPQVSQLEALAPRSFPLVHPHTLQN